MEIQKQSEQILATQEIQNKAKEISEKAGNTLGEKIKDKIDTKNSTELLQNFPQKNLVNNSKVKDALEHPDNTEIVKTMQKELGYDNVKNYYNPIHKKDMKTPDGKAGPFTIGAINTMIADDIQTGKAEKKEISNLEGVNDYISTLHPYFYNKLDKNTQLPDIPEKEQLTIIINTMSQIKEGTVTTENIKNMQTALQKINCYPSIHKKEQQDGVPGQFTQIALQTAVLTYLKGANTK